MINKYLQFGLVGVLFCALGSGFLTVNQFLDTLENDLFSVSGSWCGPCIKGIPDMRKAYDELNGEVKFVSLWNDTDLDTFLNNHKHKKETIVWISLWG